MNKFLPLVALLIFFPLISVFSENQAIKIFILHSYEANHVCGQPQADGFLKALKGKKLEIEMYHMDTKRKPEEQETKVRIAKEKILTFKPDIILTIDDNAFKHVGLKFLDYTFKGKITPVTVIFCGLNGQPENYNKTAHFMNSRNKPGHNITGVYEKLHVLDAIRIHNQVFSDAKEVRIIVDSGSPTGRAITQQIKLELENQNIVWSMKIVSNWEEYQKVIEETNHEKTIGAIYPVALQLKDKKGTTFTAPDILKWTVENSKKPELALNYAFSKLGLFGGAAVDFMKMGRQAGEIALKILNGKPTSEMPIEEAEDYALAFNIKRAQQLKIKIPEEILAASDVIYNDF
jgi:ABC-type uncharacterized transport system substrate-binding protein